MLITDCPLTVCSFCFFDQSEYTRSVRSDLMPPFNTESGHVGVLFVVSLSTYLII